MKRKRKGLFIFIVVFAMLVTLFPAGNYSYATFDGLNIAIYADSGIDSKTVTALCSAFSRMGHNPMAIAEGDLIHDRLNTTNFDILIIPNGATGTQGDVNTTLSGNEQKIKNFLNTGGGLIAIGAAANLLCANSINTNLAIYSANSVALNTVGEGMAEISIANANFGTIGQTYVVNVPKYAASFASAMNSTLIAQYEDNDAGAIVGFQYYGNGRVCLIGPSLQMEENSEVDLSIWDNLQNSFYDPESELPLLAKIVEYVNTGSVLNDTTITTPTNTGKRIAVYSQHDATNGGAWPGFLPAVYRSIQNAGHTPIAITEGDIKKGKLTTDNFDAIVFPGGYAYGYQLSLLGYYSSIQNFVNSGGGIMGICAGSFFLSNYVNWEGITYNYPVDLFTGTSIGPITDIAAWPGRALTGLDVYDEGMDLEEFLTTTYYGGGYFDGGQPFTSSAVFTDNGEDAIIRFNYGSGRVVLMAPHLEAEEGYTNDWCWWDNFEYASYNAQTDPESEWDILDKYYDWIAGSTNATALTGDGTTLGVRRGLYDTAGDSIGDAQRYDANENKSSVVYSDGLYTVPSGSFMELEGFGMGYSGTINSVTLKVKYSVQSGSNAIGPVIWRLNDSYTTYATDITPVAGDTNVVATYDLKAAGIDTLSELYKLTILYYNNDYSGGHTTSFDYVQVVVN